MDTLSAKTTLSVVTNTTKDTTAGQPATSTQTRSFRSAQRLGSDGTADQADTVYEAVVSVPLSSDLDLDLADGTLISSLGEACKFAVIRELCVAPVPNNDGDTLAVTIGGHTTDAWPFIKDLSEPDATAEIEAGSFLAWGGGVGMDVTTGADILRLTNADMASAASVYVRLVGDAP